MTNNEKTEIVKEKIFKHAFIILSLASFLLCVFKLVNVFRYGELPEYLLFASFEGATFLLCAVCLITGCFKKTVFFQKVFGVVCKTVLFHFAFISPQIPKTINFIGGTPAQSFLAMFFTVGIYVMYAFKREGMYFNDSFIRSERYFSCVFKRIAQMGIYAIICLCISVCVAFLKSNGDFIKPLIDYVGLYAFGYVLLSLLYIFCSYLEKESGEKYIGLSRGTWVSLIIAVIFSVVNIAVSVIATFFMPSQTSGLILLGYTSRINTVEMFVFVTYLVYFVYEYQKININRRLLSGASVVVASLCVSYFINELISNATYIAMNNAEYRYEILQHISYISHYITVLLDVVAVIGWSLIIKALIKDRMIDSLNIIAIVIMAILVVCGILLNDRVDALVQCFIGANVQLFLLGYLCFVTKEVTAKTPMPLAMNDF